MSERVAQMSARKQKVSPQSKGLDINIRALETLLSLLRSCKAMADLLDDVDEPTREEMLTHLSLVELDALRLLADEAEDRSA